MQSAQKILTHYICKCNLHFKLVALTMGTLYNQNYKDSGVRQMQPEIDYYRIGQRIKTARLELGYNQAELGRLVGCSNNHMSHIEIGQTKVSLTMLLRISYVLGKDLNYFLLDTPYAQRESMIGGEIAGKLEKCSPTTLVAVSKMIDVLLEQQDALQAAQEI